MATIFTTEPLPVQEMLPDLATDGSALAEEEGVRPRLVEATRKKAALGSQLTQFTRGKDESKLDSETDLFSLNLRSLVNVHFSFLDASSHLYKMVCPLVQYDGSNDDLDWRIEFKYLNFVCITKYLRSRVIKGCFIE